jgi:hypothetical protein
MKICWAIEGDVRVIKVLVAQGAQPLFVLLKRLAGRWQSSGLFVGDVQAGCRDSS